jgi:hypothetical protein
MSLEPSDRMEIEQLINDSCAWGDHGEPAEWVPRLCTEDFALHGPGTEINRDQFQERRRRRPLGTDAGWLASRVPRDHTGLRPAAGLLGSRRSEHR